MRYSKGFTENSDAACHPTKRSFECDVRHNSILGNRTHQTIWQGTRIQHDPQSNSVPGHYQGIPHPRSLLPGITLTTCPCHPPVMPPGALKELRTPASLRTSRPSYLFYPIGFELTMCQPVDCIRRDAGGA